MSNWIIRCCFVVIVLSFFSLGYSLQPIIDNKILNRFTASEVMQPMDVEYETMEMWKELQTFWKYNLTNLDEDLTEEELKEEGGVCWHYSNWFIDEAKKRGLYGKEIEFWGSGREGHSIALIYDFDISKYCIVDQTAQPHCNKLDNGGNDE